MMTTYGPQSSTTEDDEQDQPAAFDVESGGNDPLTDDGVDDDLAGLDDDQVDEDEQPAGGEFGDLPAGDYLIVQLLDGRRYPVRITMRERIGYDAVAIKRGWGRPAEAPNRAGAFMAWSAGRRDELPNHAAAFDAWVATVDDCTGLSIAARPTR